MAGHHTQERGLADTAAGEDPETLAAAAWGGWSLTRLPIDAVPDITNVQVQINGFAPALSPLA